MTVKGKQHYLLFVIVPDGHETLLGDKASEDLGLVKSIYQIHSENLILDTQCKQSDYIQRDSTTDISTKYPEVFKGHYHTPTKSS